MPSAAPAHRTSQLGHDRPAMSAAFASNQQRAESPAETKALQGDRSAWRVLAPRVHSYVCTPSSCISFYTFMVIWVLNLCCSSTALPCRLLQHEPADDMGLRQAPGTVQRPAPGLLLSVADKLCLSPDRPQSLLGSILLTLILLLSLQAPLSAAKQQPQE